MTARLSAGPISFLAMLVACGTPSANDYAAEIEAWRTEREARLKADDGWLTLSGLFFLNEGDNSLGSSPQNDIELRAGPVRAGIITLRDGRVSVQAVEGRALLVDWSRVDAAQVWPSEGSDQSTITLGPLSLFCHESDDRLAMRLRDSESEIRREFTKLRWSPVDESFWICGRHVPHGKPRTMELANNLGDVLTLRTSGSVALTVSGAPLDRNRLLLPAMVRLQRPDQRKRNLSRCEAVGVCGHAFEPRRIRDNDHFSSGGSL